MVGILMSPEAASDMGQFFIENGKEQRTNISTHVVNDDEESSNG
jgi:hypothetical protein